MTREETKQFLFQANILGESLCEITIIDVDYVIFNL